MSSKKLSANPSSGGSSLPGLFSKGREGGHFVGSGRERFFNRGVVPLLPNSLGSPARKKLDFGSEVKEPPILDAESLDSRDVEHKETKGVKESETSGSDSDDLLMFEIET